MLFTGVVVDEVLARVTPQFIENEFLQDDVNKFSWLARGPVTVGGLVHATEQKLERSPRYREILAPLALGDELRAALITSGACWGFLCLHSERSSPHFTPAEFAFIGRLTSHMAEGLRTALLLRSAIERGNDAEGASANRFRPLAGTSRVAIVGHEWASADRRNL